MLSRQSPSLWASVNRGIPGTRESTLREGGDESHAFQMEVGCMPEFTKGELEVMRILWEHGELKPGEILELFPWKITNSSLRSYLAILLDKGHVKRRRVGEGVFLQGEDSARVDLSEHGRRSGAGLLRWFGDECAVQSHSLGEALGR